MPVDAKGDLFPGRTTTSGTVVENSRPRGDSPIIRGRDVAWTTKSGRRARPARGEENIKISGGHTIIEMMRQGKTPTEACLEALGAHRAALQKR